MIYRDHFSSARSTRANAHRHINNLAAEIQAFTSKKAWSLVVQKDTESGMQFHKVKFTQTLAEHLPNMVFDAATNLRAVLDQSGYAAAVASGKIKPKNAFFPVGDDEAGLDNVIKRKRCKDLPPEILTLFRGFKPYKGGNDPIWALNRLANTKKHTILVPIGLGGFALEGGQMRFTGAGEGRPTTQIGFWWDSEKNELTFLRGAIEADISYNTNFTVSVAFDESQEIIGGQHPVAVLRTMEREVERILLATEAECRRIGLIT